MRRGKIDAVATAPINIEAFALARPPAGKDTPIFSARSHRLAARGDDVLREESCGRAGDESRAARRGAATADARARRLHRRTGRRASCRGIARAPPAALGAGRTSSRTRGEHGVIGREDGSAFCGRQSRRPALRGVDVTGADRPGDAVFGRAARGEFDARHRVLPRSGTDSGQAARLRARGQRHSSGCADRPARRSTTAPPSISPDAVSPDPSSLIEAVRLAAQCWPGAGSRKRAVANRHAEEPRDAARSWRTTRGARTTRSRPRCRSCRSRWGSSSRRDRRSRRASRLRRSAARSAGSTSAGRTGPTASTG